MGARPTGRALHTRESLSAYAFGLHTPLTSAASPRPSLHPSRRQRPRSPPSAVVFATKRHGRPKPKSSGLKRKIEVPLLSIRF